MLQRTRFGLSKLSEDELKELGRLYRRTSSDLATAAARSASPDLIIYLNGLVGRAHGTIYTAERGSMRAIKDFLLGGFPALVRAQYRYVLTATGIFFAAFIYAFIHLSHTAGTGPLADMLEGIGKNWLHNVQDPVVMSSFIMTNNIKVAFLGFATGVTFGVLTVLLTAYNGFMIAFIAVAVNSVGRGPELLAFVLPHGVIELTAIFISCGAGLMMGAALIRPGNLSRRDALKVAARPAVQMIGGVIVMLIIAGTIEGFFSPAHLPGPAKIAFGCITAVMLALYFFGAGREKQKS